ncbi:MAG: hypothetical protein GWM98_17420 [Nitrospinaceae bacterium]|nr:hypothetical protein [Nitrospinaceae bacterium]NIR55939.1 hypothetical protein [Nitrospinaceae bacterium]NIT83219.1 hypothetical protein [Nitrospinaceae bacterium]NIX35587.1 hypothetical protein [Nitrospinaceae bacterium]NIY16543.1 hypothetical protein [Nitrospinaceae bacterium]
MRILRQWLDRRTVAVGFTVFMAIFIVTLDYLDEPSARFWKNKSINKILEYLWLAFIYVGIAGLISHLKLKKSYIKRHLAVFNVTVLLTFVAIALEPFLFFWMSSPGWITLIQRIFIFFIISFMILGSIHLTKDLVKWKDWSRVTGLVLLFVLYVAWDSDDFKMNFSSSPEFPSYLSPHLNPIHDPVPLDEFLDRSSRELFRPLENGKVMEPPPATEISDTLREKPGN